MRAAETSQIISIKDERLDIDKISQYRLSFFVSDIDCQITVFDVKKKQLLLFENRELTPAKSLIENLNTIYDDHILIAAGFWKEIQVFVRNRQFALVPVPVFDRSLCKDYVQLNEVTDPNKDEYHFKVLDDVGAAVAFGYLTELKQWFKEKYPKLSLYFNHQSVAYLKGLQKQIKSKAPASLYLTLNNSDVQVVGYNLQRLAIYNQFRFTDAKHLTKLILLTLQQFSAEGQSTPIILHGIKEKVDLNMPILKKYFRHIELGKRPEGVLMHPIFNELEDQEYFEVLANL
ncbi:DUF3822 family protein [Roseivirga sp. UBA838]|uniref:DUF3822 family protein n=1 Tax=Roseivirga sp. UBA838 TaxID=1947393 RepID=UPI00257DDBCF|nr:DUF3822 family protein [Roseivirga sp. UBA838]